MNRADLELRKAGYLIYKNTHYGPSDWKDITAQQLLIIASVLRLSTGMAVAKSLLACKLYRLPVRFFKMLGGRHRGALMNSIDFLFKRNGLSKWLIKRIRVGFRMYYGPKDRLSNLTVDEFRYCEFCFESFNSSKDIKHLISLAAILYRPRRWWGIDNDIRQRLTVYGMDIRAKRFERLPEPTIWAIYLNYEGCRNLIASVYTHVFKPGKKGGKQELSRWSKIIEATAGGKFGTLQEMEQVNLHKFLSELNNRMKEAKENS